MLSIAIMIAACSDNSTKTESGVEVKHIVKENAGEFNDGAILNYNMRYANENGNDLFNTDKRGGAVAIQYSDSTWSNLGTLYEALKLCQVGDSVIFKIQAEDLFKNTFKIPLPDSIKAESYITFYAGLESAMTAEEFRNYQSERYERQSAKMQKESENRIKLDLEIIDKHLKENNIEALSTESGLKYVITKEGDGAYPKAGESVVAHYSGTLLDGTKFDSSYDRDQPFEFVLGQGAVIRGWDEGFALLNKGAKATLYIPSPLAYGSQARSAIIKANSILKFEVELVDIK